MRTQSAGQHGAWGSADGGDFRSGNSWRSGPRINCVQAPSEAGSRDTAGAAIGPGAQHSRSRIAQNRLVKANRLNATMMVNSRDGAWAVGTGGIVDAPGETGTGLAAHAWQRTRRATIKHEEQKGRSQSPQLVTAGVDGWRVQRMACSRHSTSKKALALKRVRQSAPYRTILATVPVYTETRYPRHSIAHAAGHQPTCFRIWNSQRSCSGVLFKLGSPEHSRLNLRDTFSILLS